MSAGVVLYVSGGIPKTSDHAATFSWSPDELDVVRRHLAPLKPTILSPALRGDDLRDPYATFGRDVLQIKISDAVLVDARSKRGIGVGSEMLLAKTLGIPVVSITPPDSHYRRKDLTFLGQQLDEWMHPFVAALSDFVAADINEAAAWLLRSLKDRRARIKGPELIDEAIDHYLRTQLPQDGAMLAFLQSHPKLVKSEMAKAGRQAA